MSHVLVVDDEPSICWGLEQLLTDEGHTVSTAASAEEAFRIVEGRTPDAVVLDVRLPGLDGISAIQRLREQTGNAPIVVVTAHGNLETAVQAVREGAFDYLPKPFDLEKAADVVHRALESRQTSVQTSAEPGPLPRESLIGRSPAMQVVYKQVALAAAADVPVLITGESGTGKEMVARAIHLHSHRAGKPFLPICLAALSPGLVESELFGHVRGAFTGADQRRSGLLELAEGGSVLLDEIADTEPALQVKLLRALEQREITPVGDARPRPMNVRIIAATNRNLPEFIADGRFREDLYFRLSVFRIELPPLRDRLEDVPLLAMHFLRTTRPGDSSVGLSDEVLDELQRRNWPGNVRELRNVIDHAAVVAREGAIRRDHLPAEQVPFHRASGTSSENLAARLASWFRRRLDELPDEEGAEFYEQFLAQCEPPLLRAVLDHCEGHKARAASLLGIHRTTLRQKLRKHGLDDEG